MKPLPELKRAAHDAKAAWHEARARTLKNLRSDEVLVDCGFCHQVFIALNVPPRPLWFCPCSPRVGQKGIQGRAR